ncbi:hypothetical protein [Streptomyces guryensis]|uniref:Uncharacterized protein n=1 Tax=Streptomyces guryensis TaxID=2886947 RepID=A0A9Q3ZCL6_9ACTN|nr:hypothetical protein [Streptomyces guryensis]MCD9879747.1 hypothetical protein [Streptomyces guryensis]
MPATPRWTNDGEGRGAGHMAGQRDQRAQVFGSSFWWMLCRRAIFHSAPLGDPRGR